MKILASWRTSLVLLAAYGVVLAAATIVEATSGTAMAWKYFYKAWWFIVLNGLLVVSFIAMCLRQKLVSRKRWGVLTLHWAFVVILVGAMITRLLSFEGNMHIREGESSDYIVTYDGKTVKMPFTVKLDDFRLVRYAGSRSPSSYESDITVSGAGAGADGSYQVYMNNIARVTGYRFYQASYDPDEMGTILTVNHDRWGTLITYAGYFLLFAGLFLALFEKGSRFRMLYAGLMKKGTVLALLLAVLPVVSNAQAANAQPDRKMAAEFGTLLVLPSDGRPEPVNTYASELLRKLYRGDSYGSLTAEQVLLGIISAPEKWQTEPLIYVGSGSPELRETFGTIKGRHISYAQVFAPDGSYRLTRTIEEIYRKNPRERTKTDKEYLKLDERVNVFHSLINGRMMPLFPTEDGRWLSPGDNLDGLASMEALLIGKSLHWFADALAASNITEAQKALDVIQKYQKARTAGLSHINPARIKAEIIYNNLGFFRNAFKLYLILGALLMAFTLAGRRKWACVLTIAVLAVFVFHTAGIGLRWYIAARAPWANAYETMVYVAWATMLSGLIFMHRSKLAFALTSLLAGIILFVSNLNWLDPQITPLVPVLKSPWLMFHVSVITASYGFFGMSAMCGITSLGGIISRREMPGLRNVNELAMNLGLVLLTIGIFLGAIWANESWGRYWGWDPKETWALITMVVYALVTHSHFMPRLSNDYVFSSMSVVAFLSVLMTFFGVNYYLSGMHSYGGGGGTIAGWIPLALVGVIAGLIVVAGFRRKQGILNAEDNMKRSS